MQVIDAVYAAVSGGHEHDPWHWSQLEYDHRYPMTGDSLSVVCMAVFGRLLGGGVELDNYLTNPAADIADTEAP